MTKDGGRGTDAEEPQQRRVACHPHPSHVGVPDTEGTRGQLWSRQRLLPHGQAPQNRLQSSPRDTSSLEAADRDRASRTHGDGRAGGLALGSGAGRAMSTSSAPTPTPATPPQASGLKTSTTSKTSPRTVSKLRLALRGSLRAWKAGTVSPSRSLQRPTSGKQDGPLTPAPGESATTRGYCTQGPPRADRGGEFPGPAGPTCLSRRPAAPCRRPRAMVSAPASLALQLPGLGESRTQSAGSAT